MTPNPSARPFIVGVLLFLAVTSLWPGRARAAASPAARARSARCQLLVRNKTPFRALIHLDGVYWGWVSAQQSFTFTGIPAGDTLAYATTQYAEYSWGPKSMRCAGLSSWELSF
ncbi:MAG: hypothetical protein DMF78_14545 [Acidobacteria bacterium]|nr:MAG: hypothetical protein DMF78_14545 [Acidobacteriota bacterium]